jgi:peroxiredoxin
VNRKTIARWAAYLVLLVVVGFAGLWTGGKIREWRAPEAPPAPTLDTELVAGAPFPSAPVLASDGTVADTAEQTRNGAVVHFMRFDCPACGMTVDQWRDVVAEGELAGVPVVGITSDPPEAIESYREAKAVPFPVYADPDRTFIERYGVSSVPFVVLVAPGGTIRENAVGFRPDTDFEHMREMVGG